MLRSVNLPTLHSAQVTAATLVRDHPRVVWRCGRRWGKTTALERNAAKWAYAGLKVGWFAPNYKLVTPTYKRLTYLLGPALTYKSKIDMLIEVKANRQKQALGSIEFWTLNDEDAGRSRAYDRVIIDEASLVQVGLRDVWEQSIAPTLLDRRGSAVMAGTPKGIDPNNWFYLACTDKSLGWVEHHAPTAQNPMLDPIGVGKLQDSYPPLVYQQEYLAEFVDWSGKSFFLLEDLLSDGVAPPWPNLCDSVFATIDTAVKTGKQHDGTAVCYWALIRSMPGQGQLLLLDWDIQQIEGALLEVWLPRVYQRLEEFSAQCRARMGSLGTFIEDKASGTILIQQALRRGWACTPIDSKLTSVGKEERAISVSGYVYRKMVKLCHHAYDKTSLYNGQTRNHLTAQVLGFRIGQKDAPDDLLDAFTYGVAIALGNAEGY